MENNPSVPNQPSHSIEFTPASPPVLYANGISVTISLTEIQMQLSVNSQPTHTLLISPSVAKSLQVNLVKALEEFERRSAQKILDVGQLLDVFRKNGEL